MNRRQFLVFCSAFLLASKAQANPFGLIVRGILRTTFRSLSRRSFSRFSFRTVSHSISRTSGRISSPSRISRTFGNQRHNITNKSGKIVGTAQVEDNVLIIRDLQKRILGYIQSEKNALAVYAGNGTKVLTFRHKANRVIAYNENEDYLGQIIEKTIKDEIKRVFVDSLGKEYDSIPVELQAKETSNTINKDNTIISNGRLEVFNDNKELILYGVEENENLALYDTRNILVATIRKYDGKLLVYNASGELLQTVQEGQMGSIKLEY